jgi:hypothetical protein
MVAATTAKKYRLHHAQTAHNAQRAAARRAPTAILVIRAPAWLRRSWKAVRMALLAAAGENSVRMSAMLDRLRDRTRGGTKVPNDREILQTDLRSPPRSLLGVR